VNIAGVAAADVDGNGRMSGTKYSFPRNTLEFSSRVQQIRLLFLCKR
jgi:hypothetical protein